MVRNYKRLTNRGDWSEESMKKAVDAVIEGRMGYLVASRTFSVPQTTLERKVKTARDNLESNSSTSTNKLKVPLGPKEQVFSEAKEKELSDYIMEMESRLYGLTVKNLKSLAYSLAKKNNKVHPFNTEKEEAGKDWVLGFLKRHPELSIRKPESTSAARASGFNKEVVDAFYTFLGNVYDEHQLTPNRIYNCDETGISVVPKTKSKIIAKKGRKQVGSITSAERGTTITVEICFSASGLYMPPMMIFPRKRMDPQLMLNGAPGAWGVCSDSGWMTTELFLQWFKEFVRFSGATVDRKVLLLLDGHSTHTQNIDLINEARSNGVIILCFPPHTTHRLQVADVAFMRPLSTYYDQQITAWLRSHPGMVVTVRQVGEIFGKAFVQASTMSTAVNGFRKCGIWPYDPTVFSESDFAPSLTTDIPQVQRPVTQTQTDREGASSTSNIAREDAVSPSLISPEPEFSSHSGTNVLNMATLTEIPAVLQRDASQSVPICIPASSIPSATSDAMLSVLPHTEPRIELIYMPTSNLTADAATSEVTEVSDLLCVESSSKPDYMPASDILSNTFGKATPIENLSDLSSVQPATQSVSMLSSKSPTNTPYTCISNATLSTLPRDELQAELVGFPASKVPVDITNMSKSITTPSETQLVMVRNPASPTATVTSATVTIPATKPKALPESVIFNTPTSTNERSTLANTQPQPGCSTWSDNLDIVRRPTTPMDSIFSLASPEQIIPFPTTQKTVRSTRKRGKTAIITASPYKNELEEKIKKKKEDDNKKEERKQSKISNKQNNVKSNKKTKGKQKQKKSVKRKSSPENSDSEVENTPCLFCSGLYLDSNEGWAACRACGKWAHCGCAGIDDEDEEATFTCEFCQQEYLVPQPIPHLTP